MQLLFSFLSLSLSLGRDFTGVPREPKPHDKVVYVDGGWDLFRKRSHVFLLNEFITTFLVTDIGHIRMLERAKKQGDFLIVGIYDDKVTDKKKHKFLLSVLTIFSDRK
jgi:cytidyltransferase-like protein